ncbi:DsbA family oxidoreductase [Streptantibioticus silvisoli]|uniref:DsbA family oxidoreductase n=1 Tax=Streptantibioticus silvisoli TaxID=2705255 RepID=A0ABT6VTA9_9ACTN|nr:DsbA family oxidoreductase [Streptantibioticus silvisoli]MDI5961689.1 DsbA family oxidoreductase [Streptantibioticus silvisoli]
MVNATDKAVRVEIWSDVVCPWCYIGKRRLEQALASFEHAEDVEIVWRSFQLDPSFPSGVRRPALDVLMEKTGGSREQAREMTAHVSKLAADVGLEYRLDESVMVNTLDAHRLTRLATAHGLGSQAHERLLRAQLVESQVLDDTETLVRLGVEIGLPEGETRTVLSGDGYRDEVEDDIREGQRIGVSGVPFFVLNRAYGLSGAQPAETFLQALRTVHDEQPAARA